MVATIQKLKSLRLFRRTKNLETARQIIFWWELRRIPFNLTVGFLGIFTCVFLIILESISKNPFVNEVLSISNPPTIVIFFYGVAANFCFTSGWIFELVAKAIFKEQTKFFGEILFFCGLSFSALLTLSPILICLLAVMTQR
jgi:hypothetical protein